LSVKKVNPSRLTIVERIYYYIPETQDGLNTYGVIIESIDSS